MKILTAEDILDYLIPNAKGIMSGRQYENAINAINGHTKQYVKLALKEASEKATLKKDPYYNDPDPISRESILNAYPLENIK
jgi:hypothetical protein